MGKWRKKEKFFFQSFWEGKDSSSKFRNRSIIIVGAYLLLCFLYAFEYKVSIINFHSGARTTEHTWEETFNNLPNIFIESFIIITLFILFVFLLDYFSKDKKPDLICEKCNTIKEFDSNYNCYCGGNFIKLSDMEWIKEDEDDVIIKLENSIRPRDKIILKLLTHYKSMEVLPKEIECPWCLTTVELNEEQIEKRVLVCNWCGRKYDLSTPKSWTSNGKIDEFRKLSGFLINNNKVVLSNFENNLVKERNKIIVELKNCEVLPNRIKCPSCRKKINLYKHDIFERKIICPHCLEHFDFSYEPKEN